MFIDLSKVFNFADHIILLKRFELYRMTSNRHNWIKSDPLHGEKYIHIDHTTKTSFEQVKCGVSKDQY